MILGEESSGWTVTEVDTPVTAADGAPLQSISVGAVTDPGMPTGQLNITPPPATSTGKVVLQTVVIVAAAVLVGTLVFLIVRAAVGSGSDADDQDPPLDETSIIDPGPSGNDAALADSTRSGSRRSSAADGLESESSTDGDPDIDPAPAAPLAGSDGSDSDLSASADADSAQAASSTTSSSIDIGVEIGPPSTANSSQTTVARPVPDAGATTTVVEQTPVTSTPGTDPAPTTTTTTTITSITTTTALATTTTTAQQTTTATSPPTTPSTTVAPPAALIALPSDGNSRIWGTFTRFRANTVSGATKYCWTFVSAAGQRQECTSDTVYDLPASPRGLVPGPLDVKAEAFAANNSLITDDKISISLLIGDVADEPKAGETVDLGDDLDLRSRDIRSADRYCWTISTGSVTSGEICDDDPRIRIDGNDPRLDGFVAGSASITYAAFRSGDLIAHERRRINFR